MTFQDLQLRLLEELRHRVRSGAATERGLARDTGLSQPHLHHVLKGKRLLSVEKADIVRSVNRLLTHQDMELDPESYSADAFQDEAVNLIQINVRGRILQISFHATAELVSTEEFRVPYTLNGTVRAFNQELLEKDII